MAAAMGPIKLLRYIWKRVVSGADPHIRPYERSLIECAGSQLDEQNREILIAQLSHRFLIQRLHNDRITDLYFFFPEEVPRFTFSEPDYRLAKLRIKNGRRRVDCRIAAEDGLLKALRFSKTPKPVVEGAFEISVIEGGGKFVDRITRQIDNEEHGGQYERP